MPATRAKQRNQNKPTPPLEVIEPHIRRLWATRVTDKHIVAELQKVIDLSQYGLALPKFKEIRKSLGLERTRQQSHTVESIQPAVIDLRKVYPNAGMREMHSLLFHEHGMAVSRRVMELYFRTYEPQLLRRRIANRLRRRRFWAAGVNDIWTVDQHDKWLRFGLALHIGVEPFSGRILWLKVWYTNRNPQLILSYYLETVQQLKFVPMVTQSDPGTENFGIANAQTMLRQMHDTNLTGFVQHRWMRSKKNIVPEIAWSQFRRRFAPGFESLLDVGVDEGWYDTHNTLQVMLFRWLFIPWLQQELDGYMFRVNNTQKRLDKNKVLPHGVPELIHCCSADYGALDFKVTVTQEAIDTVHGLYIDSDNRVFDLLPAPLCAHIEQCYNLLGRPAIGRTSVWGVYLQILNVLQRDQDTIPGALRELDGSATNSDHADDGGVPLIEGLHDLREQRGYYGGVANGLGPDDFLDNCDGDSLAEMNEIDADPELWVDAFSSASESANEGDSAEEVDAFL